MSILPTTKYIEIEYGRSTKTAISTLAVTNKGIVTGAKSGGCSRAIPIDVPYNLSQTSAAKRQVDMTTCIYADNTGWNYCYNTLSGDTHLDIASTYFRFWNGTQRNRNGHGSCRVVVKATYASGQQFNITDQDLYPEMLTYPAGGTTGNWAFRCYIQAHASSQTWTVRPFIRWLDDSGTVVATSIGTAVSTSSTTTWTAAVVAGAKPATATNAFVGLFVDSVFGVGNSFYVTDCYLGQQGGYFTYDGETPDDATYAYTWTGQRFNSPTQRNASANINTLASWWLTRNALTTTVTTFTANYDQDPRHLGGKLVDQTVDVLVAGTHYICDIVGVEYSVTPTQTLIKTHLVQGT